MSEEQDHLSSKDTGEEDSSPSELNPQAEFNPNEPTITFSDEDSTKSTKMPSHLGRYELHGLLGSGSFGEVYLGVDTQLGRKVAIKVPRHMSSGVQHEAFMREARRIAQLPQISTGFERVCTYQTNIRLLEIGFCLIGNHYTTELKCHFDRPIDRRCMVKTVLSLFMLKCKNGRLLISSSL